MRALGELVKARRREEGLTQGQLADKIGVTQQALGKWELGARPRAGHLRVLADFLDRPYAEVAALADEEPIDPREDVAITAKLDQLLAEIQALHERVSALEVADGDEGEKYAPRDSNPEPNDSEPFALTVVSGRRAEILSMAGRAVKVHAERRAS